jgi:senataxin
MQNNNPEEVHLLDTQYRMHPHISAFPSRTFYDGLLKDGQGMAGLRKQPWHRSALLSPYQFYDVQGQQSTAPRGRSFINNAEIEVAMALYHRLVTDFRDYDFSGRVGIITPYKAQLNALKDKFSGRYGSTILDDVEFNTTDAFQGRESEVIIFSCVRASDSGGIGFLQDIRRMNVGLTRAKSSLWVLGNSGSLVKGKYWKMLVEDAKARDCYISGDVMGKLAQSSAKFPASDLNTKAMPDAPAVKPANKIKVVETDAAASRLSSATGSHAEASAPIKADPDRMQGVQRQYKDYVSQKRKSPDTNVKSEHSRSKNDDSSADVDMADADADDDHRTTSRSVDTSSTHADKLNHAPVKSEPDRSDSAGHDDPSKKSATAAPGAGSTVPRKRPTPSPFLPRKKPK